MSAADWATDAMQVLAARFTGLGIGPNLAALTLAEAWALCRFVALAAGGAHA